MTSLIDIARGWYAYFKGTDYTKALMNKRLSVCSNCEHKEQLSASGEILVKAIHVDGSIYRCSICKCPLASLTANPSLGCKLGKWKPE